MEKKRTLKGIIIGLVKIIALILAIRILQQIFLLPLSSLSRTYWSHLNGRGLNEPWFITSSLALFLAVFIICLVFLKFIDKKPWSFLRVTPVKLKKYIAVGKTIGCIMVILFTLVNILLGNAGLSLVYTSLTGTLFYIVLLGIGIFVLALGEELVYRGYVLKTLETHCGFVAAVIISSLVFCIVHFIRPDISLPASVNIFLSGVFLSMICIYYNSLWAAVGIHFGWNFFLWFFNYPVSEQKWPNPLFKLEYLKHNLVIGSTFGPEGSILLTLILAGAISYFIFRFKNLDRS
ncbi:MAG TPA: CPBP family intramembrane metalloprotease [bacterium]|nr:CPBP family intramembrane metalloprotease [bacterium]HPN43894.1 CPBP family intramembrane metalloprotease [bacterium]